MIRAVSVLKRRDLGVRNTDLVVSEKKANNIVSAIKISAVAGEKMFTIIEIVKKAHKAIWLAWGGRGALNDVMYVFFAQG